MHGHPDTTAGSRTGSESLGTEQHRPLVSVVINAYNAEAYLPECLDSVLAQTLADFEVIVVDDASTDATGRIAQDYARRDSRVRVAHNERNLGIPATINRALELSRGELIAKMDADDASMPERLEKQVAYLRAHPEVVMVGSWWSRIDPKGRELGTQRPRPSNQRLAQQLLRRCAIVHPTIMVRGDLLRRIRYREFFRCSEDYDLFLRLAEHGQIAILPEVLVKARLTYEGMTVQHFHEEEQYARYARLFARQRRRHGRDDYERVAADPKAIRPFASQRARLVFYRYRRGLLRVTFGDMVGARREFWRALVAAPWDVRLVAWLALTLAPRPLVEALRALVWRMRWGHPPQ